jgi:small-conductance mechanosensitive channel
MLNLLDKIPVDPLVQKLIGVLLIVVITLLFALIARFILMRIIKRIALATKTELDDLLLAKTHSLVYLLIYIFGLSFLFDYLEILFGEYFGAKLFIIIDGIIYALGVFLVAQFIVKLLSTFFYWYKHNIAAKTETMVDDELIPLLDRTSKIIFYVLAVLIVLDHFNVDIKGMITVLGVGSLAVALAAQETIANMIGGFVIMIDRPFRAGDWLRLSDGLVCKVHHIGVRSTKFLTLENTLIIVPNAELIKSTVHNVTYPHPETRIKIEVGVSYDSDIEQVKNILLDIASNNKNIINDPEPFFRFEEFADSSLNVSLYCRVPNVLDQFETASDLREEVLERFRENNIEIPFPQRVVTYVNNEKTNKEFGE